MTDDLDTFLAAQGGVATTAQLLGRLGRAGFESRVARGELVSVWMGIYSRGEPDLLMRLRGLDLRAGEPVAICLGTAAGAYGFDTEDSVDLHVLNPAGHQLRNSDGLVVHRRQGAPLTMVDRRPATEPAWTAVEVARGLRRPRSLATLDAALRSRTCGRRQLYKAAVRQAGRRGIVNVRELIPLAAGESESPMESKARLAMLDGGLPPPVLQYEIVDRKPADMAGRFRLAVLSGRRRVRRVRLAQRSRGPPPRPAKACRAGRGRLDSAVDCGRRCPPSLLGHGAPDRRGVVAPAGGVNVRNSGNNPHVNLRHARWRQKVTKGQNRPPPPMNPPSEPDEPPNDVGPHPPKPPPIAPPRRSPMMMPPIMAPMLLPPP